MSKPNRDDRRDNVSKIKRNLSNTRSQMEAAEEMIAISDDPKTRDDLKAKNQRRAQAIHAMEIEIKQEAEYNKNHG